MALRRQCRLLRLDPYAEPFASTAATFPINSCVRERPVRIPLTSSAVPHWTAVSRRSCRIVNQSRVPEDSHETLASVDLHGRGALACASGAFAADCGAVTIASMNWQSAEVLANVDKFILNKGYGCTADIITGDTVPTITSMVEKGEPDVAPEGWVDLLPQVVSNGVKEGRLVEGATALTDGASQGWYIPQYVADAHPDIKTIPDVLKHPELFPAPEDPSKGAVFNGPQGWGGTVATARFFKAYDGAKHNFTLVDTGSAARLDGSIAKANEHKQGWVGIIVAHLAARQVQDGPARLRRAEH